MAKNFAKKENEEAENKSDKDAPPTAKDSMPAPNYIFFLKMLEDQPQFKSIEKLHAKIVRQRKEIEFWLKSKSNKEWAFI